MRVILGMWFAARHVLVHFSSFIQVNLTLLLPQTHCRLSKRHKTYPTETKLRGLVFSPPVLLNGVGVHSILHPLQLVHSQITAGPVFNVAVQVVNPEDLDHVVALEMHGGHAGAQFERAERSGSTKRHELGLS